MAAQRKFKVLRDSVSLGTKDGKQVLANKGDEVKLSEEKATSLVGLVQALTPLEASTASERAAAAKASGGDTPAPAEPADE